MRGELRLTLLGKVEIRWEGYPLANLTSLKAKALLIYLATTRQIYSRSALAALLWSDMPESAARANLRMALTALRKLVSEHLVITRQSVAFDQQSPHWVDVEEFETVCGIKELKAQPRRVLREAVALYRGDFLDDFYVPDAPLFEEWVSLEREHLRLLAVGCLNHLVKDAIQRRAYSEGIDDARKILVLDPWREESHRQLMILLARGGQRSAALSQYQICRQVLAEELGVEPAEETTTLYRQIRDGEISDLETLAQESSHLPSIPTPSVPRQAASPNNLPAQTTPFVGREAELAQIGELLADPGCRLLTLHGFGGAGKTRMALQAAHRCASETPPLFSDGVYFVPLAAVDSAEALLAAIAEALRFSFFGQQPLQTQLFNYLRQKVALLVLDNFEQLLVEAGLLTELLQVAPDVKLLITSQEKLDLYEEWMLEVKGLPVPDIDMGRHWDRVSSVELFRQRARRVNLGFDLEAEKNAIIQICQSVAGMPLAIELAAVWVHAFSCQDIADEIRHNLKLLSTTARNVPERQRSLRAAFTYSWDRLSPTEQNTFIKLSVFRGGFDRQAAEQVSAANARTLARLVNTAFLQRSSESRYNPHELLRNFAAQLLAEQPHTEAETRAMHGRYFTTYLHQRTDAMYASYPEATADEIGADIENVRAAWQWAVDTLAQDAISQSMDTLYEFFDLRALYLEGQRLFATAVEALESYPGKDEPTWARLLMYQGRFLVRLGRFDQAKEVLQASIPILRGHSLQRDLGYALNSLSNALRTTGAYEESKKALLDSQRVFEECGERRGVASTLNNLGLVAYRQGDYVSARQLYQRSVSIYRETGPRKDLATVLNNLGLAELVIGEYSEASAFLQESITTATEIGYRACVVVATQNLGLIAIRQNAYIKAQSHLHESLRLARELGTRDMEGQILDDLSVLYLRMGEFEQARQHCQEALQIADELGMLWLRANAYTSLGDIAMHLDDLSTAQENYKVALETASSISAHTLALGTLTGWANLLAQQDQTKPALEILAFVLNNLKDDQDKIEIAQKLFTEIAAGLPSDDIEAIRAQGQRLHIDDVITGALAYP